MLNLEKINNIKKCKICKFEAKKPESITSHITKTHKITTKSYYDKYLKLEKEGICSECNKITPFKTIGKGYSKTCSTKCKSSLAGRISQIKGGKYNWKKGVNAFTEKAKGKTYEELYGYQVAKNKKLLCSTSHIGFSPTKKTRLKQSLLMKNKIMNGLFTPKSNNRFTHKNLKLKIRNKTFLFRSSWEIDFVKFLIKNEIYDFGYETLRIPYWDSLKQKERIYIVDFYLKNSKLIIEIKPKKIYLEQNAQDKDRSLKNYCKENNLKRIIITEKDIETNYKEFRDYVKNC